LGEFGRELRRVGPPISGSAEYLREIDGRDDCTAGNGRGYNVGAGLLTKMSEQRRGVEYGRQLLGILAVGFCAPLIDHRLAGETTEQSATLLSHGAIRA
jgi:hypothetical protein